MGDLFDTQRLAEFGDAILRWFAANVFVLDNAAQLAIVLVALGIAVLAARWLPKSLPLPHPVQLAPLATLMNAMRPLAPALIWLALTWLALLLFNWVVLPRGRSCKRSDPTRCCEHIVLHNGCALL